jgi:hypothetical protein
MVGRREVPSREEIREGVRSPSMLQVERDLLESVSRGLLCWVGAPEPGALLKDRGTNHQVDLGLRILRCQLRCEQWARAYGQRHIVQKYELSYMNGIDIWIGATTIYLSSNNFLLWR